MAESLQLQRLELAAPLQSKINERRIFGREADDGHNVSVAFSHEKFREYVYPQQPVLKRKMLHRRVEAHLKKQLTCSPGDVLWYIEESCPGSVDVLVTLL